MRTFHFGIPLNSLDVRYKYVVHNGIAPIGLHDYITHGSPFNCFCLQNINSKFSRIVSTKWLIIIIWYLLRYINPCEQINGLVPLGWMLRIITMRRRRCRDGRRRHRHRCRCCRRTKLLHIINDNSRYRRRFYVCIWQIVVEWIAFGGRNSALAKRKSTNGSIIIDWQPMHARAFLLICVALRSSPNEWFTTTDLPSAYGGLTLSFILACPFFFFSISS